MNVKVFNGLILDKSGQDIKERCLSWQETCAGGTGDDFVCALYIDVCVYVRDNKIRVCALACA